MGKRPGPHFALFCVLSIQGYGVERMRGYKQHLGHVHALLLQHFIIFLYLSTSSVYLFPCFAQSTLSGF